MSSGSKVGVSTKTASSAPERSVDQILAELEVWGQKLGLERIEKLLGALGRPQDRLPTVLIAGTNGKGSTAALLAAIAHAAGARCGLYTSPHLERVEERLRLDGVAIGSEELAGLLTEVLAAAKGQTSSPPTYFETLTAAAFLFFERQNADLAVFEVGLGGRLDATNVGDPKVSVITSIGYDHQEHLGETLATIASEKAGVARRGRPLLTWTRRQPTVRETLRSIGAELELELLECDREVEATEVTGADGIGADGIGADGIGADGTELKLRTPVANYHLVSRLLGGHQIANLGLAVRAAEVLDSSGVLAIDRAAVERGVRRCRWPGRLEWVELGNGQRVLLDGAHNLQGARALVRYLQSREIECDLLYGSLRGKRAQTVLPLIAERCAEVTLSQPAAERALLADTLASYLADRRPAAAVEPDLEKALALALEGSARPLLVCGSLYVVGAARRMLRERYGHPPSAVEVVTG